MHNRSMKMLGVSAVLVLGLTACSGGGAGSDGGDDAGGGDAAPEDMTVGVAMPTQTYERWVNDGASVEEGLEELGYTADLQFANDDIPTQQQQIDQMITQEVDALIIASIDGSSLTSQLDAADAADIPVISYDRLLTNSENVDFYVTFDNFAVGQNQANALLYGLGVLDEDFEPAEDAPEETLNVELFAGSLDDNNARFFWDGAMDVLEPYIEDETIAVPSGQTTIEQAATQRWEQETAQERMENLLTSTYSGGEELHGVLAPADPLSRGIIQALRSDGLGDTIEDGLPIVTGQDAEIASVSLIADGVQHSTIFKDTRLLAEQAVNAADTFLSGEEPEANDTESYDNGSAVIPSYLLPVEMILQDNYEEILVDSEYYTEEQVESGQL
ncbi:MULTISPECIES: multiple monosaccharide ABC transporter substrate-binding protein [Nesterenkonia]|uniref:Putative multiple sugar transport system substrate-binding protein n=2 Tax=Nesterenkonia TaxID=57494 RepID=A0A0W8II30_9MICC|nr:MULTISPECIES: multiple monosaccharide ABC transporter substrate-binding protein [Nesterenkonia]KUG59628.1 sugar ABC transporter substrate-binding protein [Nesterenkonia jeotgali]MBA8922137.1 putative multiple sugar transport system substrate-binding protein [Nesterenkonia jeotgali]NYJ16337.1 putative multiple sugar transport system substrate-binding protein [Nesterenkonia sandarakina]